MNQQEAQAIRIEAGMLGQARATPALRARLRRAAAIGPLAVGTGSFRRLKHLTVPRRLNCFTEEDGMFDRDVPFIVDPGAIASLLSGSVQAARPKHASPYLTAQQAADYLQLTVKALYGLVERRKLRPLPGHRRYRFLPQQLDAYLRGEPPR